MQRNTSVLKSLTCSLLHLGPSDVTSVNILKPIKLGETIDEKTYILDIKMELNGSSIINLEMQCINEGNRPARSHCYLCRAFDNLNHGRKYEKVQPVIQIELLDFTIIFYALLDSNPFHIMLNHNRHKLLKACLCRIPPQFCLSLGRVTPKIYNIRWTIELGTDFN